MNKQSQSTPTTPPLEDTLNNIFGSSSFTDDDLLKTVEKHTLQLNGEQLLSLQFLFGEDNPFIARQMEKYLDLKHHNHSGEMIIQALGAISMRKFISSFRFNINQNK